MNSLFSLAGVLNAPSVDEFFENLLQGHGRIRVARVVSHGHTSPERGWYNQEQDEWVVVIEGNAKLFFKNGEEISLDKGEHLLIPKYRKHKVIYSSSPCIWLAIFADSLEEEQTELKIT